MKGCGSVQSIWWQLFDILGTMAFALSGTMVGISRRMDVFGVFVLSAATAVGGGIMRDVLLGTMPPVALKDSMYFWIVSCTFVAATFFLRYFNVRRRMFNRFKFIYLLSDAVGLGSFTVTGTLLACLSFPDSWVFDVTLGVFTAIGGGVIRDVLAGTVPGVLRRDVYASASLAGAVALYICYHGLMLPIELAGMICFIITVAIRIIAIMKHWNLPRVRRRIK